MFSGKVEFEEEASVGRECVIKLGKKATLERSSQLVNPLDCCSTLQVYL